jgi:hypothetical protein
MKLINLSEIPNWKYFNTEKLINWLLDNNYFGIIVDYGFGIELEIDDLNDCWEDVKNSWVKILKK